MSDNALKTLKNTNVVSLNYFRLKKNFNKKVCTWNVLKIILNFLFKKYQTLLFCSFIDEKFTFNGFPIFGHLKDVNVDIGHFRRFNDVLQFLKLYIFQSSQQCCFACMYTSNYDASHMGYVNLFFLEKLSKFLFIHFCFSVFYLKNWTNT